MENSSSEKGNSKNKNEVKDENYFNEQAKLLININLKDPDYDNIIEKDPNSLFLSLDKNTISNWEKLLINKSEKKNIPIDKEINTVERNTSFQEVIEKDCFRTRVRENLLIDNFLEKLQNIITYYCKTKNIHYKQGLNEIFGPLLLMKYKIKELQISTVYSLGEAFIDKFLPNYFYEKEFYSLKSSLGLLLILIRYHAPSVYNRLDSMEIIPEMYGTSWVMTYGMGKLKLDIVYNLLTYIITINDPLFLHFYFVSLIINKRELILNCDKNILPSLMTSLTINSIDELNIVVNKAQGLKNYTPFSFRILANKLGFLIPNNQNIKINFEKYKPLSLPAMPIFPLEVLYITNHTEVQCPDENCKTLVKFLKSKNYAIDIVKSESEEIKDYKCEKCDLKINKNMKFFLLDLRILEYGLNKEENESDKTGYLKLMINVDQEELKSEDIDNTISQRYINERGQYHFVFLTTSTDAFLNFEEKFYKINISEDEEKQIRFGLLEKKAEKELNFDSEKLTKKQIFKLKEYDNLRKILKSLKKKNYPYIGFVYDGFYGIHKRCIVYGIELLFHSEESCLLCKQKKNTKEKIKDKKDAKTEKKEKKEKNELYNKLWEHKKKIKYQNLNETFKNANKNSIFFGILLTYKKRPLESQKIQIFVVIKEEEFKIEIYKFLSNEFNLISKEGYYGLGIDNEKKDIELILIEEIKVIDVLGLKIDKKIKNIIHFDIRDYDKNQKKENISTFDIGIDFSSSNDTINFIKIFKEMSKEYKNKFKKK